MNALFNSFALVVLTLVAVSAQAQQQSSMELTCRARAKEIAAQTYSSCVTDARNTQIDQIRKDYQKQLTDLKAKYDRELKKIGGKGLTPAPATKPSPVVSNVSTGAAPKPTKGIAKTLPTRKEMKPAAPVTSENIEEKTVNTQEPAGTVIENQPTQNDANGDVKIELVPAPASSDKQAASLDEQTY